MTMIASLILSHDVYYPHAGSPNLHNLSFFLHGASQVIITLNMCNIRISVMVILHWKQSVRYVINLNNVAIKVTKFMGSEGVIYVGVFMGLSKLQDISHGLIHVGTHSLSKVNKAIHVTIVFSVSFSVIIYCSQVL